MIKTFCDLCGEEIKPYEDMCYKVKKEQYDMYSVDGHFWIKLECHEDCWKNLCAMLNDIKTKVNFNKPVDSFCTNGAERRLAELSKMSSDQFVRRITGAVEKEKFKEQEEHAGKYIDAGQLIDVLKNIRITGAETFDFNETADLICDIINEFPSTTLAVKCGKWEQIPYEVEYRCSECKGHSPYTFDEDQKKYCEFLTNFCPHCGADMRDKD